MRKKVVVGMSGGVDSSVCAYLLKEEGYEVIGMTMQIWEKDSSAEGSCCGLSAVEDARRVCDKLEIPHYVINFRQDFKERVIDYFIDEYKQGRTPNPCIACNRYVKWESMLKKALLIGADYIATGHYATVIKNKDTNRYQLKRSKSLRKDQTYALYNLTQNQLEKTLMPLGEYSKDEIREIAANIGLLVANKPDSQEICFVPDDNYSRYIAETTGVEPKRGNFINSEGKILGEHKGIINYTIGQRKGLGITFGKPVFVTKIDAKKNTITLGDNVDLFTNIIYADNPNFMDTVRFPLEVSAKIRYSHEPAKCRVVEEEGKLKCQFEEAQRAPTPGQAIVFYSDDLVIGGATIL